MINGEKTIPELADEAGLKVYDTAIPQQWVDHVLELTEKMGNRQWPYGFVWSYDKSTIFGEPYPLTDEAKKLAVEIGVKPR